MTGILWLVVLQYFLGNRYTFADQAAYKGDSLFNPYQRIDKPEWLKGNFHAHCHAWNGITNGHGSAEEVHRAYDSLGYAIHALSNYHEIDTSLHRRPAYIPAYEHGYNIQKTHQQVLGARAIFWNDFIFPQTVHNKQSILAALQRDPQAVIVLNHPSKRQGYTLEDLKVLTGYHCMEVVSAAAKSFEEWDTALSSGKRVYIIGNDDLHNVRTGDRLGRVCTMVYAPTQRQEDILTALKEGRAYAAEIGAGQDPYRVPALLGLKVHADTVSVVLTDTAQAIRVITENGRLWKSFAHCRALSFRADTTHAYYRIEAQFENGTVLYFNPVFYSEGTSPATITASIRPVATWWHRAIGLLILLGWLLLVKRLWGPGSKRGWGRGRLQRSE